MDEFVNIVEEVTPTVLEALDNCRYMPDSMTRLEEIQWPERKKTLCCKFENTVDTLTYESEYTDVNEN